MKTAVSLPDELFEAVEQLARRTKRSRSKVFADALREYVSRHTPNEVTESLNAVVERAGEKYEESRFANAAARLALKNIDW